MNTRYTYFKTLTLHSLVAGAAMAMVPALQAQVLLVADNEFEDQVTAFSGDLTSAGVVHTVYNVEDNGDMPPTFAELDANEMVIWYTGTDGTNLAFWTAEADIRNYAETGKKLWIVGLDLLYALYPTPTTYNAGDIVYDIMGIETYGVQSYGDDGEVGVPLLDVDPSVSTHFAPTISWIFETLWWADGCVVNDGIQPIYNFGPSSYVLGGFTTMMHNRDPGVLNVMTTLFEPTFINSPANRVQFIQETIAYMDLNTGVNDLGGRSIDLRFSSNPATDRVEIVCSETMLGLQVFGTDGREVFGTAGLRTENYWLDLGAMADGVYVVSVITDGDRRVTRRLVKQ